MTLLDVPAEPKSPVALTLFQPHDAYDHCSRPCIWCGWDGATWQASGRVRGWLCEDHAQEWADLLAPDVTLVYERQRLTDRSLYEDCFAFTEPGFYLSVYDAHVIWDGAD